MFLENARRSTSLGVMFQRKIGRGQHIGVAAPRDLLARHSGLRAVLSWVADIVLGNIQTGANKPRTDIGSV